MIDYTQLIQNKIWKSQLPWPNDLFPHELRSLVRDERKRSECPSPIYYLSKLTLGNAIILRNVKLIPK